MTSRPGDTHAAFQTTQWTLIGSLSSDDEATRKRALARVAELYWGPIYSFVRAKGRTPDAAREITQAFFAEKVIAKNVLSRGDPDRGRLRSYVRRCVENFIRNQTRRPANSAPILSDDGLEEALIGCNDDPERAFERNWALVTCNEALQRCEDALRREGRERHWAAFEQRIVLTARGAARPSMEQVARQAGFETSARATAAVQYARKRFLLAFNQVVAEGTMQQHVADESRRLLQVLYG